METRYLSEDLIDLHKRSIGSYDILYPIMTLASLIIYFVPNYIEFFILNSGVSFRLKKTGFEGKKYILATLAVVIIYFKWIRETNIVVPIVFALTVYNFILRIKNFFPGNTFLRKMKTGIIISFRELIKAREHPAAALSVLLIITCLNCNRMLTLMPVQMLFWFNFTIRAVQVGGMISKQEV